MSIQDDAVRKARLDAAKLATAPAKDQYGRDLGGGSWAAFLDGVEKQPWAAHAQYQSPGVQQIDRRGLNYNPDWEAAAMAGNQVNQQRLDSNAAGYGMSAGTQQPRYNIDPILLKGAAMSAQDKQRAAEDARRADITAASANTTYWGDAGSNPATTPNVTGINSQVNAATVTPKPKRNKTTNDKY